MIKASSIDPEVFMDYYKDVDPARGALGWSARDLAEQSGVGLRTIMRIEATNGVPLGRVTTLLDLKAALEAAGIEFVGSADDRPGIRLGTK